MVEACDHPQAERVPPSWDGLFTGGDDLLARAITLVEAGRLPDDLREDLVAAAAGRTVPVLGITGTGGSGKSSLPDELVRRFRLDQEDKLRVAVLAVDPTRRKGGGALLGDRIRM
ncbi:methylmalonyl-CoA mutase, partial [Saccharothrix sp. MB29]|nr:methylmalonyl-CoA mutase [Saccharothrix sp. MB29]